ncbi:MAG: PilW family protein [Pseudomonadota bacterium]
MSGFNYSQRAYTLVELLVGLFLGLFIIAMSLTYMVSSSQSFRVQTNESLIQENARFALEILTQNFRLAGLNAKENLLLNATGVVAANICSASEAGVADGNLGTGACTKDGANNNTDNNSDRIAIDYIIDAFGEPSFTATGCNGQDIVVATNAARHIVSEFWTADIDGDGIRSLYCQSFDFEASAAIGTAMPLVDGVDRMQIQYGVDADDNGIIERYQSFTNLGAANIDTVKTIRIAMLMNSGLAAATAEIDGTDTRSYTLLDAAATSFSDGRFRQVFSTTVMMPNAFN